MPPRLLSSFLPGEVPAKALLQSLYSKKTLGIGDVLMTSGLNEVTIPTSPFTTLELWTGPW